MLNLQQVVDERISFLKEQINPQNKPEENRTFQLQIDAIRSAIAAVAAVDDDNNCLSSGIRNSGGCSRSDNSSSYSTSRSKRVSDTQFRQPIPPRIFQFRTKMLHHS